MRTMILAGVAASLAAACAGHRTASPSVRMIVPVTEAENVERAALVPEADAPLAVEPTEAEAPPPDAFKTNVAPLLAQKCAPCHNPGGKMYGTMPFDDPATIVAHAEGILRRIKAPDEHAQLEDWLASQPKP